MLPAILVSLAALAACGGGSSSNPPVNPPPSGGFGNSNLNGTYVFSVAGSDVLGNFVTMMGTFTADGQGNITAGVIDVNGTAGLSAFEAAINSGIYNVGLDGRPTGTQTLPTGLVTLQTSSLTYTFDFVLTSSEHGLITEFDGNGSASGSLDLQGNVTQAQINGQSFAFNFTGTSGVNSTLCGVSFNGATVPIPLSTVGAFTLDANGNISGGQEDFNDNCVWTGPPDLSVTGGSVAIGEPFGTAVINTEVNGVTTQYNFDVFPIDATHLKFIEIDTAAPPTVLVGDAFPQASSIPAGNNVFTVAGFDSNQNALGPFTAAGILNMDGNGVITSSSVEDINDAFLVPPTVTGITGTYSSLAGGRAEIILTGFVNGNDGAACGSCAFAVYPSMGGLQMLEIDGGGTTNGIAYAQTGTTLASGQGFGMNLSGVFLDNSTGSSNQEDDIAEFTNNNGAFSGIIDFNDQGSLTFRQSFRASYEADTTVPGRGTVSPMTNAVGLNTYAVDDATTVAVSIDSTFVALGALVQQNSSAKSNAAVAHLAVLKAAQPAMQRAKSAKRRMQ